MNNEFTSIPLHDEESYVITIRRKHGVLQAPVQSVMSASVMPSAGTAFNDVAAAGTSAARSVESPLPGVIVEVMVKVGDVVKTGQTVAVLEAMKMENDIQAECDGSVAAVNVKNGDSVMEGTVLLTINKV